MTAWDDMKPGDPCEVRFPARSYWMKGKILRNGGAGHWGVELTEEVRDDVTEEVHPVGHRVTVYAEYVRPVPGHPITALVRFADRNDAALVVARGAGEDPQRGGTWSVAMEWGREAEDSPMTGAASYGLGDTFDEALSQVLGELKITDAKEVDHGG